MTRTEGNGECVMCSDCDGGVRCGDEGDDGQASRKVATMGSSGEARPLSEADIDELIGLAQAVANGWPNETAPAYVREVYIESLKEVASELVEKYIERVAILRERNAAELASEQEGGGDGA